VIAAPIPDQTMDTIAHVLLKEVIARYGTPQQLLSDRGSSFTGNLIRTIYKILGTKKIFTTAYHPQTNGAVERFNSTLKNMLAMYVNNTHDNWEEYLTLVTYAYNSTPHTTTGYSPFHLLFGRKPFHPIDTVVGKIEKQHLKLMKNIYKN
jgi:transposase InsO family protein